jgi:GntR family transcriptional regulator
VRTPLYRQIFLSLRNKIVDGEFPDGAFLPSEAELAASYEVSRITAKRVLNDLAQEGLAVRQRGRGTRVRYQGGGTIVSGSVQSLIDSLRANSRNRPRVLALEEVAAPADVALALGIAEGERVQRAVRVFSTDAAPYSHLTTYVPRAIAQAWSSDDWQALGLVSLLERAGVTVAFAEQVITATLADAALAEALDVSVGSPLLRAVRTSFDVAERPVEYLIATYPPERYRFLMTLSHDGPGRRPT